jgi:hypothetical protein
LAAAIQHDLTGYSIVSVPQSSLLAQLILHCAAAMRNGKPLGKDGVFAENSTTHLLYRSILLPFAKHSDEAECVLGSVRFRRVQARARRASGVTSFKAPPLPVRREKVQQAENPPPRTDPEQFRTALSQARQLAAKSAETTKRVHQMLATIRSGMRRAIWPCRVTQYMRSAPALGKAVLSEQQSEFVLLLARQVQTDPGRYEIVCIARPALLNIAMRSAFSTLHKMHRRLHRRPGKP